MHQRIFVAVDISDEARRKISNYIDGLRREFPHVRAGWEKPEKLHLTLKFIGKIDLVKVIKLENLIAQIAQNFSAFKLKIQNTGVFQSPKNARVLWLDVAGETQILVEINRVLENECEKIDLAKENRKYVPHLTIARIKEPQKSHDLAMRHLQTKFEPIEFEVSEIVIYESKLQPTGSIYSVVSKHKLK